MTVNSTSPVKQKSLGWTKLQAVTRFINPDHTPRRVQLAPISETDQLHHRNHPSKRRKKEYPSSIASSVLSTSTAGRLGKSFMSLQDSLLAPTGARQNQPKEVASVSSHLVDPHESIPDRLKIFLGTWNMYGRLLPIDLATFLTHNRPDFHETLLPHLDGSATHPYHLLAIGTQECERDISESLFYPSKEVWEQRLSEYLGQNYQLLQTETLAALHIAVFVWAPVRHYVKAVHSDYIKTGWANMIGNKGAVAISVQFGSRSLCFINCHLTAHQTKLTERNANVDRILKELKIQDFSSTPTKTRSLAFRLSHASRHQTRSAEKMPERRKPQASKEEHVHSSATSVIDRFDHVFLFGDTNYRINAERDWVLSTIKKGDYKSLLRFDQLSLERSDPASPLAVFKEHTINFPPTYKFDALPSPPGSTASSTSTTNTTNPDPPPFLANSASSTPATSTMDVRPMNNKRSSSLPAPDRSSLIAPNAPSLLCYDTGPKQRVPSWTDRILWYDRPRPEARQTKKIKKSKTIANDVRQTSNQWWKRNKKKSPSKDTICWWYGAVMDEQLCGASDHIPVIGVFGVYFDEWVVKKAQKMPRQSVSLQAVHENGNHPRRKKMWWRRLFSF
ncbi:inositol polyphosphate 5-phosphatase [Apophysomyces ossiformis]|uniref:Inositol polyphosphate 5-phosphatase n=1 Tax=Apophysomyces ossiformis TaxID=679940 RepID=A0A8H7BQB6_9FUNG|nr:inositol polyphosphate 5-phosphatase [Apophysomyces ossiformis]